MAEPDSILQLGIEAARDNKKEEARQLFRLLTRQEPTNVQGWLWLAGVAETREERQAALERVLELDPDNEMALKGLRALGVTVTPRSATSESTASTTPEAPARPSEAPAPASSPTRYEYEDDAFAELDNLSEAIAADTSGPVRRTESASQTARPAERAVGETGEGSKGAATTKSSKRPAESRRTDAKTRRPSRSAGDEELETGRRGISPLLALLIFLVGLGLLGLLIAFLFPDLLGGGRTAAPPNAQTAAVGTPQAGLGVTTAPPSPVATGMATPGAVASPGAEATPAAEGTPGGEATAATATAPATEPTPATEATSSAVSGAAPTPVVTAAPADVSGANPTIIPANTPLQSEGWLYDFNQPTYAASIIGNLGQFSPRNGRFVVVLAFVANTTGVAQPVPPTFFVLKDAQGRVWEARPEVSAAYVVPGVNADLAHTQPLPPDGLTRSVAILFDVAPDATDLVFFARSNPGQGWMVLRSV